MKILQVIISMDPRGGGPIQSVVSSAEVWLRHGHQCHILCFDPPDAPWIAKSSIPAFPIGPKGGSHGFLRRILPWLRYGYMPNLVGWLTANAENYDAVILNGLWNYASYGSWRALHKLAAPYFVFPHGMLDPWFNKAYPTKTAFKTLFWKLFEHKVLRDARGVLFTCDEERQLASQSFAPYVAREFTVGFGARDVEGEAREQKEAFWAVVPQARGRKVILFLGRIHPKKGIDLLIRAFARHAAQFSDFDLVIAGPDQAGWMSELQKLANELGVADRISWPGMLSGEAKWGAFRAAEFFALPSHQENFGIVVAEALALGRPVLIANKVNIWREIEADGAGLVVNDDVEGVSAGLEEMCAMSGSDLEAMSARARACFVERYDMERNAMSLLALIAGLCGDRGSLPAASEAARPLSP